MDVRTKDHLQRRNALVRRRTLKTALWPLLLAVLVAGWLYPPSGFVLLVCMGAALAVAFCLYGSRLHLHNSCPCGESGLQVRPV
jgi:polyferredoxin